MITPPTAGRRPAISHIVGRPHDDLIDVILGHGADPEQAFIGGSEQGLKDEGFEDGLLGEEPVVRDL